MPKKTTYKKSSYKKKPRSFNNSNYQKKRAIRANRDTLEMKYWDQQCEASAITDNVNNWNATTIIPTSGSPGAWFTPPQGNGFSNRNGREVFIHKIKMRGTIRVPKQLGLSASFAGDEGVCVRIIGVIDKESNGTVATGDLVMNPSVGGSSALNSFQNPNFFGRFLVFMDKTFCIQNPFWGVNGANVEQNGLVKNFKFSRSFKKPIPVKFLQQGTGTSADVLLGQVNYYALEDTVDMDAKVSLYNRVCFKEL